MAGKSLFANRRFAARETAAAELLRATGGTLIHPYDDDRVIAGQGTAALEFLEEIPDLDVICAAVSGGGLLSGTAIAAKSLRPNILCDWLRAGERGRRFAVLRFGANRAGIGKVHDRRWPAGDSIAAHAGHSSRARGPLRSGH